MADLDLGPELAAFRAGLRAWLTKVAPPGLAGLRDWYQGSTILAGSNRQGRDAHVRSEEFLAWQDTLLEHRLIYPQWPERVGGRGWESAKVAVFSEECIRLGVPRVRRGFSAELVGTALLRHGTPEQQQKFLPRIVRGEDRYCQGYSEPNSGSDLAAMETRGVVDGDELVITGQKVWTSQYEQANMIFLLCATEADKPKHQRLTFALVPLTPENNVLLRPIRQMTGAAEFAEEFFDGARTPLTHIIGGLGNGWRVALSTLDTERTGESMVAHHGFEAEFERLLRLAKERGATRAPAMRERLVSAYTRTQIMRYQAHDALTRAAEGREPGAYAYATKLLWSEHHKRLGDLAMDIVGPRSLIRPPAENALGDHELDEWQDLYLASRGGTIYAGTNEIQRNIIADRALGLPRERDVQREAR
jgi:alkylation response protein AidB-like acyl-CoA dehydrogenase